MQAPPFAAASELPDSVWRTPVLIRFGHCDPAGIVYTPEYFNIFNGVIEDWYGAALRLSYHGFIRDRRTGLGYVHVSADFARPSSLGDVIDAAVVVDAVGRTSLTLKVYAFNNGALCVCATFVTVTTSLVTHRPVSIPDDLRAALERYRSGAA